MSAWVLPDHIADVLPSEARLIEELRRELLDTAGRHGYELVIPPLVEHIESLLTGTGEDLDQQTFKLVDLLSGRTLGVRADTTQQTARIDAHLLNRQGTTRLCYCSPVLHARPQRPSASREPLQFGAELYGCSHVAADMEVVLLALQVLQTATNHTTSPTRFVLDVTDARIVPAILAQAGKDNSRTVNVHALQKALITKNTGALQEAAAKLPAATQQALQNLLSLYGTPEVINTARKLLPPEMAIGKALDELEQLSQHVQRTYPNVQVQIDLADSQGYSYYSGMHFAIYSPGSSEALVRGGRYDEVGAAFGRTRPAVGFGLDVKALAQHIAPRDPCKAIQATWHDSQDWHQAVQKLRQNGETVVVTLPEQAHEPEEIICDRVLTLQNGQWQVQPLSN